MITLSNHECMQWTPVSISMYVCTWVSLTYQFSSGEIRTDNVSLLAVYCVTACMLSLFPAFHMYHLNTLDTFTRIMTPYHHSKG